jgi:hypothetical protein
MMATPWLADTGAVRHMRGRWTVEALIAAQSRMKSEGRDHGWFGRRMYYSRNQRTLVYFANQFPYPLLDRDLQLRQIIP